MTEARFRADVIRPSQLDAEAIKTWHRMQVASPSLQRAFFTPAFALASERATGRAFVAVLHAGAAIQAFLPFQFRTAWHQRIRLAERIGGNLSDNAGIIAWPDFKTDAASLLRLCGLASLNLSHIMDGQDRFGLDAEWSEVSCVTDLSSGPNVYFAGLLARNRDFFRDTERRQRKALKAYGAVALRDTDPITTEALAGVVAVKRQQYQRTQVSDVLEVPENLRLIEVLKDSPTTECKLVLATLEAGDRVLAQHLGLQYNGVLSWWFPAYDSSAGGISPGRLLLWHIIEHAADSGVGLIDYGAGDAQYKRQFSTGTVRMGRALWSAENARALLARVWQSVEWRLARPRKLNAEQS